MSPLAVVHEVARELHEAGVPSPRVDSEHLVAHVLGLTRSGLYSSDRVLSEREATRLQELVARRRARVTTATARAIARVGGIFVAGLDAGISNRCLHWWCSDICCS